MKNTIKYYYNIEIDEINYKEGTYFFDNYMFIPYYKNIDVELYNMFLMNNYYIHKIIYNKDEKYITIFENKPYILLKIDRVDKVDINLINSFNIPVKKEKNIGWDVLWSNKIDYYEKNIETVNNEQIKESFNYFVGMAENAILLYKTLKLDDNYYICHTRINSDIDFYNPFNLIVDYKARDIAEFIKKEFFIGNFYEEYIQKYIYYSNYNDVMLFFIRLMYPSFYFDCYDEYMKDVECKNNYEDKIMDYENFLKKVYRLIRKKYQVPKIDWLI